MKYGFIKKNKLTEISLIYSYFQLASSSVLLISFHLLSATVLCIHIIDCNTSFGYSYIAFYKKKRTERPTSLNMSNKARLLWKLKRKGLTNGFVYRLFREKVIIWFWTHFGRLLWVFRLLITAFFIGWWSEGYVPAIICWMVRDKQLLAQAPQTLLMWALGNNLVALRNATIYRFIY